MENAYYGANLFYLVVICLSALSTLAGVLLWKVLKYCAKIFTRIVREALN